MGRWRRRLLLFAVLLGAYGATLALSTGGRDERTDDEAHVLLVAESIVSDGDVDLRDEYRARAWRAFTDGPVEPAGTLTNGRLHEPYGIALGALVAPAYALGGALGAELLLAALLAVAFVVAAGVARRLVPDPWPTGLTLAVGLSPPALLAAGTVAPATPAALLLIAAVALALRVRDRPRLAPTAGCAALVALLPWLAIGLLLPALVVALALARWLRRRSRGLVGFTALEVVLTSGVFFVAVNDRLFGGAVPDAARAAGAPPVGVWDLEQAGELLRAPVLALVLVAAGLLVRSRRERLAVALPEQLDVEIAVTLLLLVVAACVLQPVAALPVAAALAAWSARRVPRTTRGLVALTAVGSVWLLAAGPLT
ncbi:hypothetical protein [Paraconexibacter algicola]|uniref:Glycosyltransferase RgtA/B/C/D-like domain-containing protein n=1 Tax=Paraconexibacter algicola TaxID=2133960 RepID=A0A2T4UMM6_9ACTN|nr:hypothetical protein [Paraconexibacter algicola]PTL60506.1 hypothetical protein C7Y72_13085 [Paraconexibacter algicola]